MTTRFLCPGLFVSNPCAFAKFPAVLACWTFGSLAALAQTNAVPGNIPDVPAPDYTGTVTIPLVDLSAETGRQSIVDRDPAQYIGHPTTALLEDGHTILAVYPLGHGHGAIQMKRSDDGGRTWSARLPTPKSWETSKEVPTLFRTTGPDGAKHLLLFTGHQGPEEKTPIRLSVSNDDDKTWSELAPIGTYTGIVAMSSMLHLPNGDYLAFFHNWSRLPGQKKRATVYEVASHDGGLTWGEPQMITSSDTLFPCEPGALFSPDGRQIAVLLRENSRKAPSQIIFSDDLGKTWTQPRGLPASLVGDRHVARYAPDGRLFISFRDVLRNSPTQGDWIGWVGTYDDLVNGREGQYRVRLMQSAPDGKGDCGYPGVELLPDGTFVATSYGHWAPHEPPYVVSVRFKLAELDEKLNAEAAK